MDQGIPIQTPSQAYTDLLSDCDDEMVDEDISIIQQPLVESHQPKPFIQAKLNDLTRDLVLSKESVQFIGSHLSKNNFLSAETTFFWYSSHDEEFKKYFSLIYCNNISSLIAAMGFAYDHKEQRLLVDSSCRSLKAVLLFSMATKFHLFLQDTLCR